MRFAVTSFIGCVVALGCGGDPSDGPDATTVAATTQVASAATTGDESSGGSASTTTSASSSGESSGGPVDVTGDPATTGGGLQACDPQMAPFLGEAPAFQAAIHFDFAAATCGAASQAGDPPQIVLDVQPSGLTDATLFGLEVVTVSSGQPFDDPPAGDAEVIDLMPDLPIEFELTEVGSGLPVTVAFEIFSTGPTLIEVRAQF